jgi:hypothetical protein
MSSHSLTPEVVAIGWKVPSAAKPSAVLCIYQGYDVEQAQASIDAALAKGQVDSARTYRGRQGNYVPLPAYSADREVPAGS